MRKNKLIIVAAALSGILSLGVAAASEKHSLLSDGAAYGGSVSAGQGVLLLAKNEPDREPPAVGAGYMHAKTYPGVFESTRLYKRYSNDAAWKGSSAPAFFTEVRCTAAAHALKKDGFWKGHLRKDGTCGGDAEPLEWAVGNAINYSVQADE